MYTSIHKETEAPEKVHQNGLKEDGCPENMSVAACTKLLLPVRDALDILSGKWKIPIIISLTFGTKRFKEMEREINGITAKMLSKELKELEVNQLVRRKVFDTTPVTVEYSLTDYGSTLKPVINALKEWGVEHRKRIKGS